ncbi:unnamed protein product [Mycena citricolor]|uniref:Phospholipid/glycerol acyltransferase domain-containing protein n=1 Tax=Mycena citricolor TaxID=2018698 RepID=A0AAD2K6B0_9AGAR|nr:unnamed protein product [Mycena citricolor]
MELRLVYRVLRQISDWALVGYYSEVHVDAGKDPDALRGVPLIVLVARTHCNANRTHASPERHVTTTSLSTSRPWVCSSCPAGVTSTQPASAATIPHRRMVSFWAKSTMFKHPVLGPILTSSGAIPVRRNPDKADAAASNADLFDASTAALGRRQVIGIFPEGTSYTEPAIMQILSGAGWAALEFMRAQNGVGKMEPVIVVPVGIVYTDKSKYRSRVCVRYGVPIDVTKYMPAELFEAPPDAQAERAAVKALMKDIEDQIVQMTINAPDWETLYSARIARNILWKDEGAIPLKDWIIVNQTLIGFLSSEYEGSPEVKHALTRYFSLLHRIGISHADLDSLVPTASGRPSRAFAFRFIFTVVRTLVHPSFLLFVPSFITYLPAYIFAALGSRLPPPGEEESQSQFKTIIGGFGIGVGVGLSSFWITKALDRFVEHAIGRFPAMWLATAYFLVKLHSALVDRNFQRLRRLSTATKILLGIFQPRSWDLPESKLPAYEKPPVPAGNGFLKKHHESSGTLRGKAWLKAQPPAIPATRMIFHLLAARQGALSALASYAGRETPEKRKLEQLGAVFRHP